MRLIRITSMEGPITGVPSQKMWDGTQSIDRQGRLLVNAPVLISHDVSMVSVRSGQVDPKLAPSTNVTLTGVTVANGKSGLCVSADSVTAATR